MPKKPRRLGRVAIVGIGNELRGDDAAGMAVAQALQTKAHAGLLVVEGGPAPENQTGRLRRFEPDLIVLVDVAQMNEPPGTVRWLSWQNTSGLSASTHTTPPYMLARFLVEELACEVALVGIQPADTTFDAPLSSPVATAVNALVRGLSQVFGTIPLSAN